MTKADEVIESIFQTMEADGDLASVAAALRELWAGGDWDAERIVRAVAQAGEAE